MSNRIDKELVERNLVSSRTKSQELIKDGSVFCNGKLVSKESQKVNCEDEITILENDKLKYISRGGLKLEKAIQSFDLNFNNKKVLDIGSSTGGFTDCALKHGAREVVAVDVGTNLMDEKLREDSRIKLYEQTNIKNVDESFFKGLDFITTDVSFISIKQVVDKIHNENCKTDLVFLIKPQFECGREIAKKFKGVILNESIHKKIVLDIKKYFNENEFIMQNLDISPIKGGDGNIEYVAYFRSIEKAKNPIADNQIEKIISVAFLK